MEGGRGRGRQEQNRAGRSTGEPQRGGGGGSGEGERAGGRGGGARGGAARGRRRGWGGRGSSVSVNVLRSSPTRRRSGRRSASSISSTPGPVPTSSTSAPSGVPPGPPIRYPSQPARQHVVPAGVGALERVGVHVPLLELYRTTAVTHGTAHSCMTQLWRKRLWRKGRSCTGGDGPAPRGGLAAGGPESARRADLDVAGVRAARAGHRPAAVPAGAGRAAEPGEEHGQRMVAEMEREGLVVRERDSTGGSTGSG